MSDEMSLSDRKAGLSAAKRALLAKRLRGERKSSETGDGIQKRPLATPAPLSYTQQRIWFMHQLAPGSAAYNMHEAWRVSGPLQVTALQQGLNRVAERQPSLRTTFTTEDDRPLQVVNESLPLSVPVTDLSHLPSVERERALRREATAEAKRPFDLSSGPLLRLSLLRLDDEDHALLLTTHHIISDEWSSDVFWRELAAFYEETVAGTAVPLAPLPIHYTDFARWQQTQFESGKLAPQLDYWRRQLGGKLPLIQLPTDRPRPSQQTFRGAFMRQSLPAALLQALKALGQEAGATLYMTLLAAFQLLLHRYSQQDDILVGTPIANRQRPETKNVIGMFINTLVMRTDFSGELTFRQLLDRVRSTALDAYAHQDLPFDRLVQELHPQRDLSYNPLFQAMFVFQSADTARDLSGLTFTRIPVDSGASKFDLTLFAGEENGRLATALEYSTDLFDEVTINRMLGHWQTLLQGIVADPDAPVQSLPLLTADERTQLLQQGKGRSLPLPAAQTVIDLIVGHAQETPQATAVIFGDETLTYADLDARASQVVAHLQTRGVVPGDLVALSVSRSLQMIVGIVGILKAGAAYVPIDPAYPADRRRQIIDDANPKMTLTVDDLRNTEDRTRNPAQVTPSPDALAYVIYTSGSTGKPKGVMVTHRNLLASTLARFDYYDEPAERFLLLSSFSFDSSVAGIFWTLAQGGALVLPAPDDEKDVQQVAALIERQRVTHTLALPSLYQLLLAFAPDDALASLRVVIVAGEACPPDLGAAHYRRLPHAALYNEYGPTEATVWCSVYRLPRVSDGGPVPIGRAIANSQLLVLDGRRRPVPIGVPGELYVGGAGVTPGYWRQPELTAERFVQLSAISNWYSMNGEHSEPITDYRSPITVYRTGDLVKWLPGGNLVFLGRVDNQVKIRGYRIEPGEIEAVLARHATVGETAVSVWEREGDKQLVAYVVADTAGNGGSVDVAALKSWLGQQLPDYMVPAHFMVLAELPRMPNGKVDRRALPEPDKSVSGDRPFTPPRTEAEETLARIWAEVLRLPQVGVHDKFFELGGDSILSIQAVARARQAGLPLTPRQLVTEQTVARLAALAEQAEQTPSQMVDVAGQVSLTPIQRWFFEQQLANPHQWNQAVWYEVETAVNPTHLTTALNALIDHHPMLRARFRSIEEAVAEGWQQEVAAETPPLPLHQVSLADASPAAQAEAMQGTAAKLHATLHLSHGPLFCAALFDLGAARPPRLLLMAHHLVIDAVSWPILTADLATAYAQVAAGEAVSLPPPTTPFPQWALVLRRWGDAEATRRQLDFWREMTAAATPLPLDGPAQAANTEGQSESITVSLDAARTGALLRDVHQTYHTQIDDLLLTALVQAVADWTKRPSLLLTLERHGREEIASGVDVSQTVGWFTSLFPVTLMLADPADPGANLRAVKEQLRRVPQNGVGYGALRYLGDAATRQQLAARPQPQLLFNYLGQMDEQAAGPFRPLGEAVGPAYGPENERAHLLDVNARVENGRLRVTWQYPTDHFQADTIPRLADAYIAGLARLIDHCTGADSSRHTPSDFPLSNLEQDELDSLSALLEGLE